MKLAIDVRMLGSGGIGSYIEALLPFFIKNYECTLIGNKSQLESLKLSDRTIKVECPIKPFSIKELLSFPKDISREINKCDAFYTPYCNIPQGIKVPIYTTIHDVVFLDVPGLASKSGTFIRKLFYLYAAFRSRLIFTVSNFSKERIEKHLKTKKEIVVTYNAVPDWFSQKEEVLLEKTEQILFVGNIKKHKGLSVLLDAFTKARKEGLKAQLLITGNSENFRTSDTNIFEKLSGEISKDVIFTGKISNEELKNLYKKVKLLIQPSFYEGFGMPPLEALSLGCHVLMSDIPVFKEIYQDFPVTFFKTGDSDDLAQKIITAYQKSDEEISIPKKYSFEKTFNIIHSKISQELK
ncbi:MAG: glycosyltransferase family 4 protein [Treponema sp.]|nr:glycosyltransferase family 4 protein [Treponema sp.]